MSTVVTPPPAKPVARKASYPPEFIVEFGDECNRTITVNTMKHKVRGNWALTTLFSRDIGGRDVGSAMSSMPNTPGIRLKVQPREGKALFFDPLEKDPKLLEKINAVLKKALAAGGGNRTFVAQSSYTLNNDQMKSLCLELVAKQKDGQIFSITKGRLPTQKELEAMPGDRLHDPWNSSRFKPIYEKDYDAWARRMDQPGGA